MIQKEFHSAFDPKVTNMQLPQQELRKHPHISKAVEDQLGTPMRGQGLIMNKIVESSLSKTKFNLASSGFPRTLSLILKVPGNSLTAACLGILHPSDPLRWSSILTNHITTQQLKSQRQRSRCTCVLCKCDKRHISEPHWLGWNNLRSGYIR